MIEPRDCCLTIARRGLSSRSRGARFLFQMTYESSTGSPAVRIHRPKRTIALLVTGGFFLTANDATVKWITDALPVGEIMFFRGLVSVLIILIYVALFPGFKELRIVNFGGQAIRATTMLVSIFCYITGLQYLQLADQIAAMFTSPFFIACWRGQFSVSGSGCIAGSPSLSGSPAR